MIRKFSNFLIFRLLVKVMNSYYTKNNKKLSFIGVFGSVGKSSQTQLIAKLFKDSGYNVMATKKNTINGLGMMLSGYDTSFEEGGIFKKFLFVKHIAWTLLTKKYDYQLNSIIVMEIGFDHQGECDEFKDILSNNLDIAVITALTDEHNLNYSNILNELELDLVKRYIPKELYESLSTSDISISTKNVIIEMLKPLKYTKSYFVPSEIDKLSNSYYKGNVIDYEFVNNNFTFKNGFASLDGLNIDSNYILPQTFAKTLSIVDHIAKLYEIKNDVTVNIFQNLSLPNGRFSKFKGISNSTIIDSTYNSDPDSVIGFLDSLKQTLFNQSSSQYDLIKHNIILGEMRELGDVAKIKHEMILDQIIEIKNAYGDRIENIILLGEEWDKANQRETIAIEGNIKKLLYNNFIFNNYQKVGDIIYFYKLNLRPSSWSWIKGSQNTIFLEVLVEYLLEDKSQINKLCRQEQRWFEARKPFL